MKLTDKMHDAVRDSEVGKFLSRLIAEEHARGGDTFNLGGGGNVIQQLWKAFMSGRE
jgi:hypothetical protein